MKIKYAISLFLILLGANTFAQSNLITPYIQAWEIADTTQTHEAEKTYDLLKKNHDVAQYRQIVKEMNAYLKDNPNDRLRIRTIMFSIYGKIELGIWTEKDFVKDRLLILDCVKLANQLEDEQLMAELYAQFAELSSGTSNYVLYNLKSLELQKKIGLTHFQHVENRYHNISIGLYANEDFVQSINYGLNFLALAKDNEKIKNSNHFILQNDVIGASYLQLGKLDSANFFYQRILTRLNKSPNVNQKFQELWVTIAKGNIGRILARQNKFDQALPLLNDYLSNSVKLKSFNNAVMAANSLGNLYFNEKKYQLALVNYRYALCYAKQERILNEKVDASLGLANVFRAINQVDSAFAYYSIHQNYRDSLVTQTNKGNLAAINASLAFENIQKDLKKADSVIANQRLFKDIILFTIIILAVLAIVIHQRMLIKQKNVSTVLIQKSKTAEDEANLAKQQIAVFIENIVEKDNLINNLQTQLQRDNEQLNESLLHYTLVTEAEWERFRKEFAKAYPLFLPSLKNKLPSINPAEERLATLLCLKLSTFQIANTLGISKDSVSRSKRRLKNRLNLINDDKVEDFICQLS